MEPELLSVVAPVFNEVGNLAELQSQLEVALARLPVASEILWIDDCSSDGSWALLQSLERTAVALPSGCGLFRVQALRLSRNLGQSAALWHGIACSQADYVATIDSDLQNDPADLPRLFDELRRRNLDVVSGVRSERQDRWLRRRASRIANRVRAWFLADPFTDIGCSLKIYRRSFLTGIPRFDGLHRFLPIFAVWNGARSGEVAVNHRARTHGTSKYGAVRGRLARGIGDLIAMLWLRSRWLPTSGGETPGLEDGFGSDVWTNDEVEDGGRAWKESASGWPLASSARHSFSRDS